MRRSSVYEANDGMTFATAAECKHHEQIECQTKLVGLTDGDICAAIKREDIPLADAIERIGSIIADKRRLDGVIKRRPKNKPNPADPNAAMAAIKKDMKAIS